MTEPAGDGLVQIAYLHSEHVSHSFIDSLWRSYDYDRTLPQPRLAPKRMNLRCGAGRLVPTRNQGCELFLDKTPHEWLMFIDSDMGWEDDAIHRLLEEADPVDRPVVGGLCFALMEAQYDGAGGYRFNIVPTMYKIGITTEGARPSFCYYGPYEPDTVTRVAGTGAAFLLIHRSVLEKLRAEYGNRWWDQMYDEEGTMVGEDIAFCARLGKAGVPVHVHTGVRTTHHKEIWLSEDDLWAQHADGLPPVPPGLPVFIHIGESFAALMAGEHDHDGMLKLPTDLDRYRQIIAATRPDVIVETGTHTGASAHWFAGETGVDVITIDIHPQSPANLAARSANGRQIAFVQGDSTDPDVVAEVVKLVAGRRCMVSLDSDHSAAHVRREIEAYGSLVSPGCYLVVEDTLFGYGVDADKNIHGMAEVDGSPLDAVVSHLAGNPAWSRDAAIEQQGQPVSQNPAGWWVRNG